MTRHIQKNVGFFESYQERKRIKKVEMFYKKGVLENFAKFTRNHLCQAWPATLLKKRL